MSEAYVEIDFFQMEKRSHASLPASARAPSSLRGIQRVVSSINPQLVKTVMAAGRAGRSPYNVAAAWPPTPCSSPSPSRTTPPAAVPTLNSAASRSTSSCSSSSLCTDVAPLTIFYNGTVNTFDVARDKAEAIMRMAETGAVGNLKEIRPVDSSVGGDEEVEGDLPIARRKSLRRFLEKRKDRLTSASPYLRELAHLVPAD